MVLEEFVGRASRKERREARRQIKQERKAMRAKARQLRREGKQAEAKALRKEIRKNIKALRREKNLGLLGLGKSILPRIKKAQSQNDNQALIKTTGEAKETQETTPSVTQEATPTITNTSSASVPTGGGFDIGSSAAQQSSEPEENEEEIEKTDKGQEGKPNKKSKKWLWIGGGIALLVIGIVLFLVLKNKE